MKKSELRGLIREELINEFKGQNFDYLLMDKISNDIEELSSRIGKYDVESVNKKIDSIIIDLNKLKGTKK